MWAGQGGSDGVGSEVSQRARGRSLPGARQLGLTQRHRLEEGGSAG